MVCFYLPYIQLSITVLVVYVIFMERFRGLKPKGVTMEGMEIHHPHVTPPTKGKLKGAIATKPGYLTVVWI